ncbi:MAG TPA: SPFH domain-containing protein [Phycisphaeraceae bacterium]
MTYDQHTYKRAESAALIGLAVQLAVALTIAVLGVYAQSAPLHAAAWYCFGGLPAWIILWVVFHQHRLERLEALEAEQLARADARAAALFEEAGEQLHLARKRLENLYKWGLPVVSLLMAAYLLGVGLTLLYLNNDLAQSSGLRAAVLGPTANPSVVAILCVVVAFAAFLVARYVAGMTRLRQWQLLRGGAAYLMGNAAVAGLLMVGFGLARFTGSRAVLEVLALAVPGFAALLGGEILVRFLLDAYRPRRPDEAPRAAFDSRILGWLTRPESLGKIISETLNYQFGFEVSRSWFYRLLAKAVTPLVITGAVVLLALSSLVIVPPHQNAVITRFGRLERVVTPGLYLKWPWPIGRADKYDVHRVEQISVGSLPEGRKPGVAILWTTEHAQGQEQFLLTAATRDANAPEDRDSPMGGLVGGEVVVKYRIADLEQYARVADHRGSTGRAGSGSLGMPERMLQTLAQRRVMQHFITRSIDELLSQDRLEAGQILQRQLQEDVDRHQLGLEVVFVGLVGVHPPQASEVAAKFHEQIEALQEREVTIHEAQKEAGSLLAEVAGSREMALRIDEAISTLESSKNKLESLRAAEQAEAAVQAMEEQIAQQEVAIERLLDEAGGEAAKLLHEARAERWELALGEQARAHRFLAQLPAYRAAPQYYQARQYFEALVEGLKDQRKVILTTQSQQPATLRIDLQQQESSLQSFLNPQGQE